ncbi:hypothetical protein XA68_16728 [Ophiocordyceps unilateralis]|uniref:Uncharacterized protein n=1 Tax=Ophiocordyceps unilateralis TaxID=268505 RepID=A0A2A9P558_OPHUN|nr:hypothetical protein XA68_16728 [Ophiocordyceps unilateralis]
MPPPPRSSSVQGESDDKERDDPRIADAWPQGRMQERKSSIRQRALLPTPCLELCRTLPNSGKPESLVSRAVLPWSLEAAWNRSHPSVVGSLVAPIIRGIDQTKGTAHTSISFFQAPSAFPRRQPPRPLQPHRSQQKTICVTEERKRRVLLLPLVIGPRPETPHTHTPLGRHAFLDKAPLIQGDSNAAHLPIDSNPSPPALSRNTATATHHAGLKKQPHRTNPPPKSHLLPLWLFIISSTLPRSCSLVPRPARSFVAPAAASKPTLQCRPAPEATPGQTPTAARGRPAFATAHIPGPGAPRH